MRWFPGSGRMTGSSEVTEPKCSADTPRHQLAEEFKMTWQLVGGPGVKPGFAASDAAVLFGYTTHPSGTRAGNPTRISSLGPKRHHALDHASLTNVEGMQRIEL